jgi:hypothetical protein
VLPSRLLGSGFFGSKLNRSRWLGIQRVRGFRPDLHAHLDYTPRAEPFVTPVAAPLQLEEIRLQAQRTLLQRSAHD